MLMTHHLSIDLVYESTTLIDPPKIQTTQSTMRGDIKGGSTLGFQIFLLTCLVVLGVGDTVFIAILQWLVQSQQFLCNNPNIVCSVSIRLCVHMYTCVLTLGLTIAIPHLDVTHQLLLTKV